MNIPIATGIIHYLQIREAQAQTKDRLDELTLENCQLRKKLLHKSEEFSYYRSRVESTGARTISSYKEKVIAVGNRAALSVSLLPHLGH